MFTIFYITRLEIYYYKGYAVVGYNNYDSGYASFFFFISNLHFGTIILRNLDRANKLISYLAKELVYKVINIKLLE
jgi:hypothetical protein